MEFNPKVIHINQCQDQQLQISTLQSQNFLLKLNKVKYAKDLMKGQVKHSQNVILASYALNLVEFLFQALEMFASINIKLV